MFNSYVRLPEGTLYPVLLQLISSTSLQNSAHCRLQALQAASVSERTLASDWSEEITPALIDIEIDGNLMGI